MIFQDCSFLLQQVIVFCMNLRSFPYVLNGFQDWKAVENKELDRARYYCKHFYGYSDYLSRKRSFWWIHVPNHRCCEQVKCENVSRLIVQKIRKLLLNRLVAMKWCKICKERCAGPYVSGMRVLPVKVTKCILDTLHFYWSYTTLKIILHTTRQVGSYLTSSAPHNA